MAKGSRLEGWREVSKQLNNMSAAMARGVGRRSLKVPAEMLASGVRKRVPILSGDLYESVDVHPSKSVRGRPHLEVRADDIASVQVEFGNSDQAAEPFFRPEIAAGQDRRFKAFADALAVETEQAVINKARRDAKKALKG